jgi:hypothetical protein
VRDLEHSVPLRYRRLWFSLGLYSSGPERRGSVASGANRHSLADARRKPR